MLARKLSQKEINEKVSKLIDMLSPFGFVCEHEFRFSHPDVPDHDFDFSAYNPEKIVYLIYQAGINAGRSNMAADIRELLATGTK